MRPRFSSTTLRTLRACLAVTSTLWLLGACCDPGDASCRELVNDDAGPADDTGLAPAFTAGCSPDAIRDEADGTTCATCVGDDGPTDVCGVADVARCESREDARGAPCSFCATDFGEILYDSCFTASPVPAERCEASPGGVDEAGNAFTCETCTDADGDVVQLTCEPESDECHEETTDAGLACRVCTRDGEVVVRTCSQPDIAPRSCEVYANELGRCVDCFGDEDELLTHFCTLAEDVFLSCNTSTTPDGLRCEQCFDQNGSQVSVSCDLVDPTLQQCALLDYSEQSCVVCLGAANDVARIECTRKDCDDPATCGPPPDCALDLGADGELCRTCPTDDGALEQQCVVDTNLACADVFDERTGGVCLSCVDIASSREVFRRCDGGSIPPTCFATENEEGDVCEVCLDSQTGDPVYAACPSQTCYDVGDFVLAGANGNTLFLGGQPAVASCNECALTPPEGLTDGSDFQAVCTLRTDCGALDLANPDAACDGTVAFALRPHLCENPWELAGFSSFAPASADELQLILSFALDADALALVAVQHAVAEANAAPPPCEQECGCERGDVLELVTRPQDAARAVELFGAVLDRCESDADCRAGTVCRLDGGCG